MIDFAVTNVKVLASGQTKVAQQLCNVVSVQVSVQSAHTPPLGEEPGLMLTCNQLQRVRLR